MIQGRTAADFVVEALLKECIGQSFSEAALAVDLLVAKPVEHECRFRVDHVGDIGTHFTFAGLGFDKNAVVIGNPYFLGALVVDPEPVFGNQVVEIGLFWVITLVWATQRPHISLKAPGSTSSAS
jgi:hypothetical protein